MPTISIPDRVRFAIYLAVAIGSLVVKYCFDKGYIGDDEVNLWLGIAAIGSTLSLANVSKTGERFIP